MDSEPSRDGMTGIMALKTLFISMVGTAFAEMCALPFYYPYDLVKVRMQTM